MSAGNSKPEKGFRPIRDPQRYQSIDITEHLQQLDGDIKYYTEQLLNEKYVQSGYKSINNPKMTDERWLLMDKKPFICSC